MYREGVDESDEPLDFDDDDQTADEGNRRLGLGRPKKVAGAKRGPRVMWTQAKQQQKRDLLAKEAAEGIARAKLEDPDIDAKDNDIRLLSVNCFLIFCFVTTDSVAQKSHYKLGTCRGRVAFKLKH